MGKLLLLLALVGVAVWWLAGRRRDTPVPRDPVPPPPPAAPAAAPQAMIACAHCGVHLPQADTVADAAGRAFCSEAHRLAGPR